MQNSNDQNGTMQINISLGEGYQPSDRMAAAINELAAAVQDSHSEVQGFGAHGQDASLSSFQASWSPGSALSFSAWSSNPAPTPSPAPIQSPSPRSIGQRP